MATGAVALLLKNPARSSKLRQKNLRTSEAYQGVYSAHFPINTWPVVAAMIRSAENAIVRSHQKRAGSRGQHLSAWRGVLSYVAVVRVLGSFSYTHGDLIGLDLSRITEPFMDECWNAIAQVSGGTFSGKVSDARVERICSSLATQWSIAGTILQGKREIPKPPPTAPAAQPKPGRPVDEAFVVAVSAALPPQPWKPGVHTEVAAKLGAKPFKVSNAIQVLIARGAWMQQRDGVVYDASGKEIMRDESRVPGETLPGGGKRNDGVGQVWDKV
jgi:hypothetical protein